MTAFSVDVLWTNSAGGVWNLANNWSPNRIPQAGDRVLLTNVGSYTASLTNSTAIGSLLLGTPGGAQTLNIVSNAVLTVSTLVGLNGGALQGGGQLNVQSQMDWAAGRMFGPGVTRISGGATLSIRPGPSDPPRLAGRRLDNAGTVDWFGRGLAADSGALVNNLAGSIFDVHTNGALAGSWTFNNAGDFRKSAGLGTLTLAGLFNNSNSVTVQAGALSLDGGGTHAGLFSVANAASLVIASVSPNTHSLRSGAIVGGNVSFSGVTSSTNLPIRIDGAYNVAGLTAVGRGVTVNFSSTSTVTSLGTNVLVNGGILNLDSASSITVTNLSLVGGKLTGSNTVTVIGTMGWTNSSVEGTGTLNTPGRVTLEGANGLLGWRFNHSGQAYWNSGSLASGNGSVINSASNATFQILADGAMTHSGGALNQFNNAGLLRKTGGTGATVLVGTFTNSGTVQLEAGTLSLNASYHQAAGATRLIGGNLSATDLDLAAGLLEGSGYVGGSVSNNATVLLGQDRPPLFITGDFLQSSNGVLFVDLPMLATKTNQLVIGGSAYLQGTVTNCLDCLLPNFNIPARTNYAFLTLSNPPATVINQSLTVLFPTNRVGLAVSVVNDSRLVTGGQSAVIDVVNTRPYFPYNDLGHIPEALPYTRNLNASDDDLPPQTLTYELLSAIPPGLSLSPAGLLAWTPDECQGPTNYVLTVRITDDGALPLSSTTNLSIAVDEVNLPPVFLPIPALTNSETAPFSYRVTAIDPDCPTNTVRYALSNAPPGMLINANSGLISWTPLGQGGSNFVVDVIATDTNVAAAASATVSTSFTLFVVRAPALFVTDTNLIPRTNFSVIESFPVTILLSAISPDVPGATLSFSLTNQPPGMTITNTGPTNGVVSWTPTEAQGPTNVVFQVIANDGFVSVSTNIHVQVTETNNFPPLFVFPVPGYTNYSTSSKKYNGNRISAIATDPDIPPRAITYAVVNSAPFTVGANSGVVNWNNNLTLGTTYPLTLVATDAGTPALSTTNRINVTYVSTNAFPIFVYPPANTTFSVRTNSLLSFNFEAIDLDLPRQALTYAKVGTWPAGAALSVSNFTWTPSGGQTGIYTLSVRVTDDGGSLSSQSATQTFMVKVREGTNSPPFFALATTNLTFLEHSNNVATLNATDPDPGDSLTWSLLPPVPAGLAVDNAGHLSWTPAADAGPSVNLVTVQVTDESAESATTNLFITVLEANTAPDFSPPVAGTFYSVLTNEPICLVFSSVDLDIPSNNIVDIELASGPAGAVVTSSPGANFASATLCWTNPGVAGTNSFTLRTWDTNTLDAVHPHLTNTATFSIIVRQTNANAPVLTVSNANVTIVELVPSQITNVSATDADLPANILQYSVAATNLADQSAVPNLSIDPNTGVVAWTPTEAQGPGDYLVTVEVYDDGFPALTNRGTFTIHVLEDNQAPDLDPIDSPQFSPEGVATTINVVATDDDLPAQALSYAVHATNVLTGLQVSNMTINASGVLSWTPTEDQAPSTNFVVVEVWDSDPLNPLTNSVAFTNIATEVNVAPSFVSPASGTTFCITTGAVFSVTNVVYDADVPTNSLGFVTTFPAGAVLTRSATGGTNFAVITWTNTLALGSTQHFVLAAWDTNLFVSTNISLSATNDLIVVTLPDNPTPPALSVVADPLSIEENVTSTITNVIVTDSDSNSIFNFALVSVVEINTSTPTLSPSINVTNGVITWHPSSTEAPGAYLVTLLVTNPGCPTYVVGTNFLVNVLVTNHAPQISYPTNGQVFSNSVGNVFTLTALATDDTTPATNLNWTLSSPPTNSYAFTNGVLTWTPVVDQIGTNNFSIQVSDTNAVPRSASVAFSVVVEPAVGPLILTEPVAPAGTFFLEVNLKPGLTYNLQSSLDCRPNSRWTTVWTVTPTNGPVVFAVEADRLATNGTLFYRALIKP
ncbi:MAG TPA: putative Ig domain-containing protein [Candidatus Saccharimonadales bacterium]|nr:putative Ig domain-containing protein [Candidatus Saccharimonadales bacterium]